MREAIRGGAAVVVVGAGWIGLETAAAARQYGCAVTVIEPSATPLRAALGTEMGGLFARLHRQAHRLAGRELSARFGVVA